jgi:hypothetical protein
MHAGQLLRGKLHNHIDKALCGAMSLTSLATKGGAHLGEEFQFLRIPWMPWSRELNAGPSSNGAGGGRNDVLYSMLSGLRGGT